MDYIALNYDQHRARGVVYNSKKPIGGIYYPDNKERPVTVEQDPTSGRPRAFVEIEKKFAEREEKFLEKNQEEIKKIGEKYSDRNGDILENHDELVAEKLEELEKAKARFEERLERQKRRALRRVEEKLLDQHDQELERIAKEKEKEAKRIAKENESNIQDYKIIVNNTEVDFGELGIKKADLSWQDKDWLAKAQNYFITAKEKGRRVGSAEVYTSMEALEGLWSTAQTVGIDPKRFIVQIYNETRFNPNAKGAAGERGIGQFKKSTAIANGYDWYLMKAGMAGYAYQAKAAAEFVKKVGEVAYNGKGSQARKYRDKISQRIEYIQNSSPTCVLKDSTLCISKS